MNRNTIIVFLSISVIILFVIFSNIAFINELDRIERSAVLAELQVSSINDIATIRLVLYEYMKPIQLAATSFSSLINFETKESIEIFLQNLKAMGNFISVELVTDEGFTFSSDGINSILVDYDKSLKMQNRESFITDVYYDEKHKENILSFAVPIPSDGDAYYLMGNLSVKKLNDLFEKNFSGDGRYFHIIDGNGSYVSTTENEFTLDSKIPFFAVGELIQTASDYSTKAVYSDFQTKKSGMFVYSMNDESRYMYYSPVGINDWMLAKVVTAETAETSAILYRNNSYLMVLQNTSFLASFAFILIMLARKTAKNMKELQDCIEALAIQTNKVIVEWDNKNKILIPHSDYHKIFGNNFTINKKLKKDHISEIVHKDDVEVFSDALKAVQKKGSLHDVQVRIKKANGKYIWCSISTASITNKKGKYVKTLGFVENVQEIVEKTEALKKTAEIDLLTGLYNKVTTELFIENTILKYPKVFSALFIIDFDNFKTLNDTFGHTVGDKALKEISKEIRALFRRSDIVGRVGGDEFFAFLLNYGTMELLHAKAKYLCTKLKKTYSKKGQSVQITFSVGIALFPEHGEDCTDLYKAADKALYEVKEAGKSGYCISGDEVNLCRD